MNLHRHHIVILFLVLLAACSPKVPKEYIQPDDMEDLIYDYHVAQGIAAQQEGNQDYNRRLTFELVLKKHGLTQQEWDKKLSVPARDKTVDALSGQVVGEDKACSISAPEIQSLGVRGLKNTMLEVVKVRGGDVTAYGDFKRQMQENGRVTLQSLDPRTRVRSADMVKVLFRGMHIDCNV